MTTALKTRLVQPLRQAAIGTMLEGFGLLRLAGIGKGLAGRGAIFMLHLVRPPDTRAFRPNRQLEVTPDFLDAALTRLARDGYEFIAMDAVPDRLAGPPGGRPFAAFTLDDGYANNLVHAAPVFARHTAPFTVYVTSGFIDGSHTMWWETLAELLNRVTGTLELDVGTGTKRYRLESYADRQVAFDTIAGLIGAGDEAVAVTLLDAAARRHGLDARALTRSLVLDRAQLAELAALPLAAIGAHTISHRGLRGLTDIELEREIALSASLVADMTGKMPTSFAYPYGDRRSVGEREVAAVERAGFRSAVTTSPGTLTEALSGRLAALPRVSLNGNFQVPRHVATLASGLPFVLTGRRDDLG